jgi:hypothetical protein
LSLDKDCEIDGRAREESKKNKDERRRRAKCFAK